MAAAGPFKRPSDGKPLRASFVQCAGSRDQNHLPYCSSVCCMATLKHSELVHLQNADAKVFIVYKDMRTPGQYEKYYAKAQNPGTFLTQGRGGRG